MDRGHGHVSQARPVNNPARRGFGMCPSMDRRTLGATFAFGLNRPGVHVASASAMTMSSWMPGANMFAERTSPPPRSR